MKKPFPFSSVEKSFSFNSVEKAVGSSSCVDHPAALIKAYSVLKFALGELDY
jgi:hypothetical protein